MTTIGGIHHFAIRVRNLAAAERFYREVLGLTVRRRWPATTGDGDRSVWLDTGDSVGTFVALEAVEGEAGADSDDTNANADNPDTGTDTNSHNRDLGVETSGHYLLALRIHRDQRAVWEAKLAAAGATVFHRSAYTLYFTDPEGNRLGLSHHPDPAEQP